MKVNWTVFKSFVINRGLKAQVIETDLQYHLFAYDESFGINCILSKNTGVPDEVIDFEQNYKVAWNAKIDVRQWTDTNRLKVENLPTPGQSIPSHNTKLTYVDLNSLVGDLNPSDRMDYNTQYDVYSYAGKGLIYGFLLHLEALDKAYLIDLIVDGLNVFGNGFDTDKQTGHFEKWGLRLWPGHLRDFGFLGLYQEKDTLIWEGPNKTPIYFHQSIVLRVKRTVSGQRVFRSGAVIISKE